MVSLISSLAVGTNYEVSASDNVGLVLVPWLLFGHS